LAEALAQGFKMGHLPFDMANEQKREQLQNAMSSLNLQNEPERFGLEKQTGELNNQQTQLKNSLMEKYGPEQAESELALQKAQTADLNSPWHQLGKFSGTIGQEMQLETLKKQYGENHPLVKKAELALALDKERERSMINSKNSIAEYRGWNSLPSHEKSDFLSYAPALGIGKNELIKEFNAGKDIHQIAAERGMDYTDLQKEYTPTTANITDEKKREALGREVDVLEKFVTHAMAPYIKTWNGYSPDLLYDQLKGKNKEQVADYLAARGLQSGLAGARTKLEGGSISLEALNNMVEKTFGNSKVRQFLLDSDIYERMQERLNSVLKEGANAYTSSIKGMGKKSSNSGNDPLGIR